MKLVSRRPSPATTLVALPALIATLALGGAQEAKAGVSLNTIDDHATSVRNGARVHVRGPIACTQGERITIRISVRQAKTGARARGRWIGHCTGEVQRWHVSARVRGYARLASGRARVRAVGRTRAAGRVTDTRRWSRRVSVSPRRVVR